MSGAVFKCIEQKAKLEASRALERSGPGSADEMMASFYGRQSGEVLGVTSGLYSGIFLYHTTGLLAAGVAGGITIALSVGLLAYKFSYNAHRQSPETTSDLTSENEKDEPAISRISFRREHENAPQKSHPTTTQQRVFKMHP